MKLESLKDLDKLMRLCRKQGVSAIEIDNIKFSLGPEVISNRQVNRQVTDNSIVAGAFDPGHITTDELSPEDLLFYSATGQTQTS